MIFKLFSQREKEKSRSGKEDVYQYDTVPTKLRVQIQQLFEDAIGPQYYLGPYSTGSPRHNPRDWREINKVLCREFGTHHLTDRHVQSPFEDVINFIGRCETSEFIDVLEVVCRWIELVVAQYGEYDRQSRGIVVEPFAAIDEINYRLRKSGLGFSFAEGQILRVDSDYTHDEIVKPALRLTSGKHFQGSQDEFLQAHAHYRAGEYEQAVTLAGRSLESALKGACEAKGWAYPTNARASDLLKIVRKNALWPDYLDGSFDQLIATLGSGLPKVRNDAGAHGQGSIKRTVPPYVARYALNLCATKISMISEAAN